MPLTFGIEIEAIALRFADSDAPFPRSTDHQLQLIQQALRKTNVEALVYLPTSTRGAGPDFTKWNIVYDVTVMEVTSGSDADDRASRTRFGFELVSPIFVEGSNWKDQVFRAITGVDADFKWKANRSTGLHVHVGRGPNGMAFHLDELKKIAIFCVRFESAMDEFHPIHRRTDNDNIMSNRNNDFLKSLSNNEAYQRIMTAGTPTDICRIMNYSGGNVLYDGYQDSKFFKVNFTSLAKHGTIEFRQHEGSVQWESIIVWTRLVLQVVNCSISAPFDTLMKDGGSYEDLLKFFKPQGAGN